MAGQIDTVETDFAEQQERDLIGTWDYSKRLLVKCESDGKYKEEEKPSKNALNIYKVMVWLEKKNGHIIKNHAIKRHSRIMVPKELKDFILIIGEETSIAEESKQTQEEYEINYEDCMIFQHEQYPGKDKKDKNKVAEDIMSGDMNAEEIVKKNPMLFPFFKDLIYFNNLRDSVAQQLISKGLSTKNSVQFQEIQNRIECLLKSIVENSKQEMKGLLELCSFDWKTLKMNILSKIQNSQCSYESEWRTLAMKMYDRFCSNDGFDYKDDLLNKKFTEHEKTKTCIENFRKRFEEYIKKYNYDIISFDINEFHESIYGKYAPKEEGVDRPKFDSYIKDGPTGPMICFHDTQGFVVYAEDVKIKNGKFSCKLCFEFYDHFGLDSEDLNKFDIYPVLRTGFQGWYILQHFNECETGCKAFVDYATDEEMLEVEIE